MQRMAGEFIIDKYDRLQVDNMMRRYLSRMKAFNPGAKFLIMCANPSQRLGIADEKQFAFHLFSWMYKRYNAANVIYLHAIEFNQYNVYSTNPYRNENQCGESEFAFSK